MDIYRQYFIKLDEIRTENNISIETFCEDICSDRQYRRYISGENIISQKRFSLFLLKLSITPDEFYASFYKSKNVLFQSIREVYVLILEKNFDKAQKQLNILETSSILGEENKRFFNLCKILFSYYTNSITPYNASDRLKTLIDYPNCLTKKQFTFIELEAMNNIALINGKLKIVNDALNLKRILEKESFQYLSSNNRYMLPAIYLSLTKVFGMNNLVKEALEIARRGVQCSLDYYDNKYLVELYYLQSYAQYLQGMRDEAFESAKKCISTCSSINDPNKFTKYNNLFLKEQGIQFEITTKK